MYHRRPTNLNADLPIGVLSETALSWLSAQFDADQIGEDGMAATSKDSHVAHDAMGSREGKEDQVGVMAGFASGCSSLRCLRLSNVMGQSHRLWRGKITDGLALSTWYGTFSKDTGMHCEQGERVACRHSRWCQV